MASDALVDSATSKVALIASTAVLIPSRTVLTRARVASFATVSSVVSDALVMRVVSVAKSTALRVVSCVMIREEPKKAGNQSWFLSGRRFASQSRFTCAARYQEVALKFDEVTDVKEVKYLHLIT